MKNKLKKLDHIIQKNGGPLNTKLGPDGRPYKEVNVDDVDLAKEKDFIMKMLHRK